MATTPEMLSFWSQLATRNKAALYQRHVAFDTAQAGYLPGRHVTAFLYEGLAPAGLDFRHGATGRKLEKGIPAFTGHHVAAHADFIAIIDFFHWMRRVAITIDAKNLALA